jgi:hypothetical protein
VPRTSRRCTVKKSSGPPAMTRRCMTVSGRLTSPTVTVCHHAPHLQQAVNDRPSTAEAERIRVPRLPKTPWPGAPGRGYGTVPPKSGASSGRPLIARAFSRAGRRGGRRRHPTRARCSPPR